MRSMLPLGLVSLLACSAASSSPSSSSPSPSSADASGTEVSDSTSAAAQADAGAVAIATGTAASGSFTLGANGCPMAHCTPHLDDTNAYPAPSGRVTGAAVASGGGANVGLGCVSNGTNVACQLEDGSSNVVAHYYDLSGNELWNTSATFPSGTLNLSAPIIAMEGDIVVAGIGFAARLDKTGKVLWQNNGFTGSPVSPVLVGGTKIVMATSDTGSKSAPVVVLRVSDGTMIGQPLNIPSDEPTVTGYFKATNTSSTFSDGNGDRLYVTAGLVAAQGKAPDSSITGRLIAIDIPDNASPRVSWSFEFAGTSGGSPLVVDNGGVARIIFDGDGDYGTAAATTGLRMFALDDLQSSDGTGHYQEAFETPLDKDPVTGAELSGDVLANASLDPRGGFWTFVSGNQYLQRFSTTDGTCQQFVDVNALAGAGSGPGAPFVASSATTVVGDPSHPVLVTAATRFGATVAVLAKVVGLDVSGAAGCAAPTGSLAFSFPTNAPSFAQFPVVTGPTGLPLVIAPTAVGGPYFISGTK